MIAGGLVSAWGFDQLAKNPKLTELSVPQKEKNQTLEVLRKEQGSFYVPSVYTGAIIGLFTMIGAAINLFEKKSAQT